MKDRMASSFSQTVRVQKAFPVSRRTATARQPISDFACQAERSDWTKKAGRYRQDRTRRRVIDTKATWLPPRLVGQQENFELRQPNGNTGMAANFHDQLSPPYRSGV